MIVPSASFTACISNYSVVVTCTGATPLKSRTNSVEKSVTTSPEILDVYEVRLRVIVHEASAIEKP